MFSKEKPGSQEYEDLVTFHKKLFMHSLLRRDAAKERGEISAATVEQPFEIKAFHVDIRFEREGGGPSIDGSLPPGTENLSSILDS